MFSPHLWQVFLRHPLVVVRVVVSLVQRDAGHLALAVFVVSVVTVAVAVAQVVGSAVGDLLVASIEVSIGQTCSPKFEFCS